MSKEEYLKGERKEKALEIIRYCIANRLTNEETLELLKSKKYSIAERTLRRFKSQIYDKSGDSVLEVYQENVGAFLLDDILMFNEMERQCLKLFQSSTNNNEKIKVISVLRLVKAEKIRILKQYPHARFGQNETIFKRGFRPSKTTSPNVSEDNAWPKF